MPVLSICFFISCSTDDTALNTVETTTTDSAFQQTTTKSLSVAANTANVYDNAGRLYSEILTKYFQTYSSSSLMLETTITNVDNAALTNSEFASIGNYSGLNPTNMQWTLANINNTSAIITKAGLSENGKMIMINFISLLPTFEPLPFSTVYNTIKALETSVSNDTSLNRVDRQIILSAFSIARYSIYYSIEKPRRWEKVRASVLASSVTNELQLAITTSVSADLLTY